MSANLVCVAVFDKPEIIEEALRAFGLKPEVGEGLVIKGGGRSVNGATIKVDKAQFGGTGDMGFVPTGEEYKFYMMDVDEYRLQQKCKEYMTAGTPFKTAFRQAYTVLQLEKNAKKSGIRFQKKAGQKFGQPLKLTAFA